MSNLGDIAAGTSENERPRRGRPKGVKESAPRKRKVTRLEAQMRFQRLQQSGAMARTSARLLYALGDEGYWLRLFEELEGLEDWRTIAELLKFHLQMRDGRPAQQINVTSANVTFSADEIEKARDVVRELIGRNRNVGAVEMIGRGAIVSEHDTFGGGFALPSPSEEKENGETMLRAGKGEEKGGV